jgi:hypothetical protein
VDISGWYVSDDAAQPVRYAFPPGTLIAPGEHVSVDETLLGFSFSSTGSEVIMLTNSDGVTGQDYFDYGPMTPDISQGRFPDGSSNWHFFFPSSRDVANDCGTGVPPLGPVVNLRFSSKSIFAWDALPGAEAYDVATGDVALLSLTNGNFGVAVTGCAENNLEAATTWDGTVPAVGQGVFYLIRGVTFSCSFGTYDTGLPGQSGARDPTIDVAPGTCP